jgi:trigger factor
MLSNLDVDAKESYNFKFDLGLAPKFEVKGVSASDTYSLYDIEVSDTMLNDEIDAARRRFGKQVAVEDTIENMDMIKVNASEVGGEWKTEFSILVDVIKDENVKKALLTKKIGDTFEFDVLKLEDKDQTYVNKYLLNKPEDSEAEIGANFVGTVTEVSRIQLAEYNEEFFSTFGDESITDEASLREFFKKDLKSYYNEQAKQYMYREIMDNMMAINDIPLPEDFLKRYLVEVNENVTEEDVAKEFDAFKTNMKWSLQKSELAKEYEITVLEEDLRKHFTNTVFNYMRGYGNMDYSFISSTVDRLMKDKDQVNKAYEEILASRVFDKIGEVVKTNAVPIKQEDFLEKVKALNQKVNNL